MRPLARSLPLVLVTHQRLAKLALWSAIAAVVTFTTAATVHATGLTQTEDFTSTAGRDPATTANWNAATGDVRLYPFTPGYLGSISGIPNSFGLAVSGRYLYQPVMRYGIQVFDLANPAQPSLVGAWIDPAPDQFWGMQNVAVFGHYLVGTEARGDNKGLRVFDISNPTQPVHVGQLGGWGHESVVPFGPGVVVSTEARGVWVIDLGDPAHPVRRGVVGFEPGRGGDSMSRLAANGPYVYLAHIEEPEQGQAFVFKDGWTVDLRDPDQLTATLLPWGDMLPGFFAPSGNVAYMCSNYGVQVADVNAPASPFLTPTNVPVSTRDMALDGTRLVVVEPDWFDTFDVSDPAAPVQDLRIFGAGGWGLAVAGDYAYATDINVGMRVFNLTRGYPGAVGGQIAGAGATAVRHWGRYLLASTVNDGLRIFDLKTNPASIAGTLPWPTPLHAIDVGADRAYVAAGTSGILLVNLGNLASPSVVGQFNTAGFAWDVVHATPYSYVADGADGLVIVDDRREFLTFRVGGYDTPGEVRDLALAGNLAYLADHGNGLVIVNVGNESAPAAVGSETSFPGIVAVAVSGNRVYAADETAGLVIYDITNPALPNVAATVPIPGGAQSVALRGMTILVGTAHDGLAQVDVSGAVPVRREGCPVPGALIGLDRDGDRVAVVSASGDISFVEIARDDVDGTRCVAQSLPVNTGSSDTVVRARLSADYDAEVRFAMRVDPAAQFASAPVNSETWMLFPPYPANSGDQLQWRASLIPSTATAPRLRSVMAEYYLAAPFVKAVNAVGAPPSMRLVFGRSGLDFPDIAADHVTEYSVYRTSVVPKQGARVDAAALREGAELVATVPATEQDEYAVSVPANPCAATSYFVVASSPTGEHTSAGVTTDGHNPPPAPQHLHLQGGEIAWDPITVPTFVEYRVYGALTEDPGSFVYLLATTTETSFDVSAHLMWPYFRVLGVDACGDEGTHASLQFGLTAAPELPVLVTRLYAAHPNPFNPRTTLRFDLATPGAAELSIFDLAGRRVRTLVQTAQHEAGTTSLVWDGADDAGNAMASGTYFARLLTRDRNETAKLTLLR